MARQTGDLDAALSAVASNYNRGSAFRQVVTEYLADRGIDARNVASRAPRHGASKPRERRAEADIITPTFALATSASSVTRAQVLSQRIDAAATVEGRPNSAFVVRRNGAKRIESSYVVLSLETFADLIEGQRD